jgi:hypothetical protein
MDKFIVYTPTPKLILEELVDSSESSEDYDASASGKKHFDDFIEIVPDVPETRIHRGDVRDVLNERIKKPKRRGETIKVETDDDMLKYLEGYEEVDDTASLPYLTHVRYISFRDGVPKFGMGGYLVCDQADRVLITSSHRRFCWTILKEHINPLTNEPYERTRFFKKLSPTDILAYQTDHDMNALRARVAELEATVRTLQSSLSEVSSILESRLLPLTPPVKPRRRKVATKTV